jgi:transcriptional regulator with XRE-family HTH domain
MTSPPPVGLLSKPRSSTGFSSMEGREVRAIRRRLTLTQRELAQQVGVTRNTVTRRELGLLGIKESAAILFRQLGAKGKSDGKN